MIVLISGPTAVGKTKISIDLAKLYNAVIINTDKAAMYKETNIGTAKITNEEMDGIKHYFINNISLNDEYSIRDFQIEARKVLDNLIKNKQNVIIVGGSGLYSKVLLYDYIFPEEEKVRKEEIFDEFSNKELKEEANKIEENSIHENNRKRLIRFIMSTPNKEIGKNNKLYDFISIGVTTDRQNLYNRINKRVEEMFEKGLLLEAKELYKKYNNLKYIIGYKELIPYFDKNITLEEVKETIKKNTRHYAKRQFTWFNNQMKDITWFNVDYSNINETTKKISEYINSLQ